MRATIKGCGDDIEPKTRTHTVATEALVMEGDHGLVGPMISIQHRHDQRLLGVLLNDPDIKRDLLADQRREPVDLTMEPSDACTIQANINLVCMDRPNVLDIEMHGG
jgi:hypothetical protein